MLVDASHRLVPVTSVEEVGEDVPPATGDGAFSPPAHLLTFTL